jgi:hypothetical protein
MKKIMFVLVIVFVVTAMGGRAWGDMMLNNAAHPPKSQNLETSQQRLKKNDKKNRPIRKAKGKTTKETHYVSPILKKY